MAIIYYVNPIEIYVAVKFRHSKQFYSNNYHQSPIELQIILPFIQKLLIATLFYNSPHNQKYVIVIDFSFPYLYGQSAVVEKSRYLQEGRLQPSTISLEWGF